MADYKKITWNFLMSAIGNPYGVAGLMGNMQAESGIDPNNTQDSYEKKLGMKNAEYTKAVDTGKYTKFASDSVGFGLCQWTSSNRKAKLLEYSKKKGASVGDIQLQLEFLMLELEESYKSVLTGLKTAKDVYTASTLVLTKFEQPAKQGTAVKNLRASYGKDIYAKYNNTSQPSVTKPATSSTTEVVKPATESVSTNKTVPLNYKAGKIYTVDVNTSLNVRLKPVEKNGKLVKGTKIGSALKKGSKVTNHATMLICGQIWMFIGMYGRYERWICAYDGEKTYVK